MAEQIQPSTLPTSSVPSATANKKTELTSAGLYTKAEDNGLTQTINAEPITSSISSIRRVVRIRQAETIEFNFEAPENSKRYSAVPETSSSGTELIVQNPTQVREQSEILMSDEDVKGGCDTYQQDIGTCIVAATPSTVDEDLTEMTSKIVDLAIADLAQDSSGRSDVLHTTSPSSSESTAEQYESKHIFQRNIKTGDILHEDKQLGKVTVFDTVARYWDMRETLLKPFSKTLGCLDKGLKNDPKGNDDNKDDKNIIFAVEGYEDMNNEGASSYPDHVLSKKKDRLTYPRRLMRLLEHEVDMPKYKRHLPGEYDKVVKINACHVEKQLITYMLWNNGFIQDRMIQEQTGGKPIWYRVLAMTPENYMDRDAVANTTIYISKSEIERRSYDRNRDADDNSGICRDCEMFIKEVEAKFNIKINVEVVEVEDIGNAEFAKKVNNEGNNSGD